MLGPWVLLPASEPTQFPWGGGTGSQLSKLGVSNSSSIT